MNVVSGASCPETLAIQLACGSRKIRVKSRQKVIIDQRNAIFGAEDNMNQVEAQRLRHCWDYMSGLQPFTALANRYLGLRPRLVCRRTYGPQAPEPRFKRGVFAKYANSVSSASEGAVTT